MSTTILIKNLVCPCCVLYVTDVAKQLGLANAEVSMAGLRLPVAPSDIQLHQLDKQLRLVGLEIVLERKSAIVEMVKARVRDFVNDEKMGLRHNLSDYVVGKLPYNYSYLSQLFSKSEGMTIREFMIAFKIERAKQMLVVDGLDLMGISIRLNYSSIAHLSAQFKKVTGMTATEYKQIVSKKDDLRMKVA